MKKLSKKKKVVWDHILLVVDWMEDLNESLQVIVIKRQGLNRLRPCSKQNTVDSSVAKSMGFFYIVAAGRSRTQFLSGNPTEHDWASFGRDWVGFQ